MCSPKLLIDRVGVHQNKFYMTIQQHNVAAFEPLIIYLLAAFWGGGILSMLEHSIMKEYSQKLQMLHTNSTTSDVLDLSGPSSGWARTICTTIKLRCLNTLTELACKVKLTWKFPLWSLARETEGQTTKRRTASRLLSRFILPRSHRVIGVFTSQGSCLNFYTYVTDFPRGQKWPNLTS